MTKGTKDLLWSIVAIAIGVYAGQRLLPMVLPLPKIGG